VEGSECQIEAGLAFVKSALKTAMNEARTVESKSGSKFFIKLLEEIYDRVAPMISEGEN